MAMFEELGQLLNGGSTLSKLGSLAGGDNDKTSKAIGGAIPMLLGALGKKSGSPAGAAALFNLVKGDNGGMLDNIGGFLDGGDKGGIGATLVSGLLGKRSSAVHAGLAEHSGLSLGGITKLLPMLAPLVMGFLSKKRAAGNLDQAGLVKLLGDERTSISNAGHGNLLGLLDGDDDDDNRGFLDGLTKVAGLGGLGSLLPNLGKIVGGVGAVGAAGAAAAAAGAGKVTGAASGAVGKVGATGAALTNDVKKKRGALIWLLPLLALAALLALLLTQCGKDDDDNTVTTDTTVVAVDTTVAADAAVVETTVAVDAAAVETTVAAAVDTTVAAAAVDTTVAAATDTTVAAATDTTVAAAAAPTATDNLLATAAKAGSFTKLAAAVDTAGLTDTLNGPGPFTLFAPTDDAFSALPAGVLDSLLKPENKDTLAAILKYHVVSGAVASSAITTGDVPTVEGSTLAVVADAGKVTVNGANVITPDVAATNGVIHVIDQVLVPTTVDLSKLGAAAPAPVTNAAGDAVSEDLTIYFATGSAFIDAEGQAKIAKAVADLKPKGSGTIAAIGHADKQGNAARNLQLSKSRAANVVTALKAGLGADASKFTITSDAKGDSEQLADLAKSRRVTIEIK